MPLRFDQPSLLGEWKGDPAIIHQALSQIHSASEGEKNRANAKAIAEEKAKAVKKPSFKISSAKSPFSKDRDNISARINTMLDPTVDDNTKAHLDQQNLQDVAQAEAQKKALEALEKSVVDIEQRHGKNARTKVFRDAFSDIYTNSTVADRDEKLAKAAEILAKPEEYIDGDGVVMDYFNTLKPVAPTYKSSKESGQTTKEDETVSHTRFPLDGDPALDSNGQQLMNNGVPVYKKRIANNPRELLGYADNYLKNNDEYSGILHTQTAKKYKTDFEKEVNNWAGTFDTPPSEEEKQSFLQGLVANKTRNDIAEKFYKNDKAWIDANSKVSSDEPRQATGVQKDAVAAVLDEAVNTNTNVGGVEKRQSIYRPNAIVLTNSKPQNYNLSGDVINVDDNSRAKFTGSTNATLSTLYTRMKIGDKNFIFEAEDKDGNKLPPPTHEKIMQTIRNTPVGTKIKSDVHGIMDIVTKDNTKGVMSQEQIARLEELKKWEKLHPESPRIKDDAETAKKRNELYKLRSETQNPNQTVSAEAVNSGNLFRAFGVKTIEEGTRSKKLPLEVRQRFANILEQQKAIEEHNNRTQPKTQSNKGVTVPTSPNNKPKEEEPQKGSFNDIYGKNHMTYVDVAKKHTGNTDELLSKFADWEKKNEGGNGGGYNWGTNDPSIDTKEKAIAKYKKEYLPMVKDLPEGVKNIGLQQAINIGDPWGAALTAAGVYDEKGNSSTAGVRGDNRRAKNQESIYKANQKAVFDSYNKDPEAFKQRYSKAVKYHYDNAKPIGSSNVSDKKAEELRNKYKY